MTDKPFLYVGTIGQIGHGSTTLTSAIVLRQQHRLGKPRDPLPIFTAHRINPARPLFEHTNYETATRLYAHFDRPGHSEAIRGMIMGYTSRECAILVVSAPDGPTPQTREQVRVASRVGVPHVVVYLSKSDQVDDQDLIDLCEVETRQLLQRHGYLGDETLVIRGNALAAVEAKGRDDAACACINELLSALDGIPMPGRDEDRPFLLGIEDVFHVNARGTVVTGRIEFGKVKVGDEVEILGQGKATTRTIVTGIESFQKFLEYGMAGDTAAMLLRGVELRDVERGQVMVAPGSVRTHTRFEAEVYLLAPEKDGRLTSVSSGYRPQLYFRTTEVAGEVTLAESAEICAPGTNASVTIELPQETPVVLEVGLRFGIREGGRAVGCGVVTRALD